MKYTRKIGVSALIGTLTGCSLVTTNHLSDDVLTQKTGNAIGLDKSEFTISNRQEPNKNSDVYYIVTTKTGKKFNCSVAAGFTSIVTPATEASDAICNEIGRASDNSEDNVKCNALLKAAGKCK